MRGKGVLRVNVDQSHKALFLKVLSKVFFRSRD